MQKEYQLIESTCIPCAAVAPMPSPWQDIQAPKSKRWVAGKYISEELACFLEGMSTSMKKQFNFVNITGNAFNTITDN
jgi:hypothetical protein